MNRSKHIIKKTFFSVHQSEHQVNPEKWSGLFHQTIMPVLEEVLDNYGLTDQHYLIDKLEINLGNVDPDDHLAIASHFRKVLTQQLPAWQKQQQHPGEVIQKDSSKHVFEIFLFYLDNGRFPWWTAYYRRLKVETALLGLYPDLKGIPTTYLSQLLGFLLQHPRARLRLAQQFSPRFIEYLSKAFIPLWRQVGYQETIKPLSAKTWDSIPLNKRLQHLEEWLKIIPRTKSKQVNTINNKIEEQIEKSPTVDEAQGVAVSSAGLVLLHPYLKRFFAVLGLFEDNAFRDENAHSVAVRLLYHLAHGQENNPEEHELILPKLLCGLPLHAPIDMAVPIDDSAWAEITGLLQAVIKHWDKLKNTSLANFRASFLQRNGIIYLREEKWSLRVDQRPYDILLDYLPWPVAVLKLPWMNQALFIDWA